MDQPIATAHARVNGQDEDQPAIERAAISVTELAQALGISRSMAYQLVNDGTVRAFRLGRRIVVPVTAVEELVARHASA